MLTAKRAPQMTTTKSFPEPWEAEVASSQASATEAEVPAEAIVGRVVPAEAGSPAGSCRASRRTASPATDRRSHQPPAEGDEYLVY